MRFIPAVVDNNCVKARQIGILDRVHAQWLGAYTQRCQRLLECLIKASHIAHLEAGCDARIAEHDRHDPFTNRCRGGVFNNQRSVG